MKLSKRLKPIVVFILLAISMNAFAGTYTVQSGDTLSSIAFEKMGAPIYKKNGSLERLLSYNPQIKNPNFIHPGEILQLQDSSLIPSLATGETEKRSPAEDQPPPLVAAEDPGFKRYGEFGFNAGFDYFKISGVDANTGATALILSNASPTLGIEWSQHWSETMKSYMRFNYMDVTLQDPSPRTMSPSSEGVYGFDLGIEDKISPSMSLIFNLGYDQQLFVRSLSTTTLTLDAEALPSASLGTRIEFMRKDPFVAGLELYTGYLASGSTSSYNIQSGQSYSGSLYMTEDLPNLKAMLRGQIYYDQLYQSSSLVYQNRTDVGANLSLMWKLGP